MRGRTPKCPQSFRVLTLVHPNPLLLPSIMINPFSTPNRKDSSLQTMKRRLCRRLGGSQTKPSTDFDNETLCSLSDSDCSTLVDYDFDDVVVEDTSESDYSEGNSDFLPFDEQSWTRRSAPERSRVSRSDMGAFRLYAREGQSQDGLLDEEDCSWVMPRSSGKALKSRFALFARRPKHTNARAGLEPQLLDPEERSWM